MNRQLIKLFVIAILPGLFVQQLHTQTIQTPAEFEPNEGVLLVWDYHPARDSVIANIAGAITDAAKVWIIFYPGAAPADTGQIRNYLLNRGVGYKNVHFIPAWTETLWIRDFGPLPYYAPSGSSPLRLYDAGYSQYNRPKDDSIPRQLSRYWNLPFASLPLELEGGNLMFDGFLRGFGSKRLLDQNAPYSQTQVSAILKNSFGLDDFVFLDKLLNSGGGIWMHVDMYMKILDHETIMISQYPASVPDYPVIENFAAYIGTLSSVFGRKYNIIRIPAPPKANGSYATTLNDEMRSYTNSLIINNVVVVPKYNLPMDNIARQIYEAAMPGYQIKMVDSRMLTPLYGAIHCVTREIPNRQKLRIRHARVSGAQMYSSNFPVLFQVFSNTLIDSAFICYRTSSNTDFTKVWVYLSCGGFLEIIPDLLPTDTVQYYIEAWAQSAKVTFPMVAPEAHYTFWFKNTTGTRLLEVSEQLRITPNPATDRLTIFAGDQPVIDGKVQFYDLNGREIFLTNLNMAPDFTLPSSLSSGLYLVRVSTAHWQGIARLVVNKK